MASERANEDEAISESATDFADDFLRAAVRSIDGAFGEGFAKENPALVGQYIAACATNLGAMMQATTAAMTSGGLGDMLAAMEDDDEDEFGIDLDDFLPAKTPRKKS